MNKIEWVSRKGVHPYDYMSSIEKFNEAELPPEEEFYSKLNNSDISHEDYEYAQKVWKEFKMNTMGDYHDLYLKTDVLLLADEFEEFRNVCVENYKLDPAWYFTASGLAWATAFKETDVQLELPTDVHMLLMIGKGIRGGVSMISDHFGWANNKYMSEAYDETKPTKCNTYLDATNLYGWVMCQPLLVRGFKWMADFENWRELPCILEVDLEYPREIHHLHNDYPLALESLTISKVEKLIPNLYDRERYIVHHKTLKQYLDSVWGSRRFIGV